MLLWLLVLISGSRFSFVLEERWIVVIIVCLQITPIDDNSTDIIAAMIWLQVPGLSSRWRLHGGWTVLLWVSKSFSINFFHILCETSIKLLWMDIFIIFLSVVLNPRNYVFLWVRIISKQDAVAQNSNLTTSIRYFDCDVCCRFGFCGVGEGYCDQVSVNDHQLVKPSKPLKAAKSR